MANNSGVAFSLLFSIVIYVTLYFRPDILSSFSIRHCSYDLSPVLRAPADCEQHNRAAGLHQSHLHTDGLFCCSSRRVPVVFGTWSRERPLHVT